MRVLSLTQPWCSLVAIGAKRYETRSWSTPHRGLLAIAAAKSFPGDCRALCYKNPPFTDVLYAAGYTTLRHLMNDCGHIIAVVELVACVRTAGAVPVRTSDGLFSETVPPGEHELAFGDYSDGRFAWMTRNVRRLVKPIPAKGKLGLWTFPDETIEKELVALDIDEQRRFGTVAR